MQVDFHPYRCLVACVNEKLTTIEVKIGGNAQFDSIRQYILNRSRNIARRIGRIYGWIQDAKFPHKIYRSRYPRCMSRWFGGQNSCWYRRLRNRKTGWGRDLALALAGWAERILGTAKGWKIYLRIRIECEMKYKQS
jgi:hypothetical protein